MGRLVRPAAASLVVAAAGLVWAPSPAGAAACSSDSGVTVVVDFKQLGGGIHQDCVSDQGQADDLFVAAGHSLENVNNQAFVCRVDGLPGSNQESCTRTPPANAYWGLWWSDGTDGTWTYSSQGVYQLDVPDGGAVAFAWNNSSTTAKPGVAPPDHDGSTSSPAPEPSTPPSGGGGGPGGGSGGGGGTAGGAGRPGTAPTSASASPTDDPSSTGGPARPGRRDGATDQPTKAAEKKAAADRKKRERDAESTEEPTEEPTGSVTGDPEPATATAAEPPSDAGDGGLPVWVGPSAAGGALGLAALAAYLRRRAA